MPGKIKAMLRRTGSITASTQACTANVQLLEKYDIHVKSREQIDPEWAAHSNQATYDSSSLLNSKQVFH